MSIFPRLTGLLLLANALASGQDLQLQNLRLDSSERFQLDAFGTADLVLTLHRIERDGSNVTPVGIELSQAGLPRTLTEAVATQQNTGIFRVIGRDLLTSTFDSDLDGIKDSTERQAVLFLDAFDGTDAAIADVFDLASVFSISGGNPEAGSGTIEGAHNVDLYRFPGVGGTGLFFDVTSFDSELSLHQYYVIDPYGTILGTGRFGLSDLGPVALPFTGEYLLMVGDIDRPETGSYSFEVTAIPIPEEFEINIGDTIDLDDPAPGAGNIEAPAAYDIFTFTASAGDRIFLDTLSFSGTNSINYRLIDPDGEQLATQQLNLGDMGTVELPLDGIYSLEVGEAGNNSTGTYSLALTAIPDPDVFAINIGDTIADGAQGVGSGNIEVPGAFDHYTFTATAGDRVFLDTLSFDGVNSIAYRLFDPNEVELDSQQLNLGDMGTVELPLNGTYTLKVGRTHNSSTGTYSIAITAIPEPENFLISIGDTISDGSPAAGAGNIEVPGAFDLYTFTATAGDTIFLHTLSFTGVNSLVYRLFDPNEVQLGTQQFNLGDMGTVELPTSGTYTLEVGRANNNSTGTYSIAITDIPTPVVYPIAVGDTISDGIPAAGAGNIEVPGAFDLYTFTATAGDTIFLHTLSFTGVNSLVYRLFDPNEVQLGTQQFNLGDMGTVELPTSGTYTLEVGRANNNATGTYSFSIASVPPPHVFAINVGDSISNGVPGAGAGNIEVSGALDHYTFSANAGDSIDIIADSSVGVGSIGYRLFDSENNQVANRAFFTSASNIVLPSTGAYTLEFGEANNANTGTYALSIILSP